MAPSESPLKSVLPNILQSEGRKRSISSPSSDTSDEERTTRRRNIEQLECRTTFDLGFDQVNVLETVAALLREYSHGDYYAYERGENWHVGLGSRASLFVDGEGRTMTIVTQEGRKAQDVKVPLANIAREFVTKATKHGCGNVYGYIGFNYASHVRSQQYNC